MALHNKNFDNAGVPNEYYAFSAETRFTYKKRIEFSITHKSIPDKKDTGETWAEIKFKLF